MYKSFCQRGFNSLKFYSKNIKKSQKGLEFIDIEEEWEDDQPKKSQKSNFSQRNDNNQRNFQNQDNDFQKKIQKQDNTIQKQNNNIQKDQNFQNSTLNTLDENFEEKPKKDKRPPYAKYVEGPFKNSKERDENVSISGKVYPEEITPKMKELIENLELPVEPNSLLSAMCHPSYGYSKIKNNQRLSFIGSSVLQFCVAEELSNIYKDEASSNLDLFTSLYSTHSILYSIGKSFKLEECILIYGYNELSLKKKKEAISDCLLAMIGAVYDHNGLEKTKKFIHEKIIRGISPNLAFTFLGNANPKVISYSVLEVIETLTGHPPVEHYDKINQTDFRCSLFAVDDKELLSVGNGSTKQIAYEMALLNFYSSLRQKIPEK